jgi:hypothetical protein
MREKRLCGIASASGTGEHQFESRQGVQFLGFLWPIPSFLLFDTQTTHIKSFYTQRYCYVSLKTLYIPWRDSNPGLLVPEADAMSTAPRRLGVFRIYMHITMLLFVT